MHYPIHIITKAYTLYTYALQSPDRYMCSVELTLYRTYIVAPQISSENDKMKENLLAHMLAGKCSLIDSKNCTYSQCTIILFVLIIITEIRNDKDKQILNTKQKYENNLSRQN